VSRIYVPERSLLKDNSFYHKQDSAATPHPQKDKKKLNFFKKSLKFYRTLWEFIGFHKIKYDTIGIDGKILFFLPKKSGHPFQPLFLYMSVNCIIIYLK